MCFFLTFMCAHLVCAYKAFVFVCVGGGGESILLYRQTCLGMISDIERVKSVNLYTLLRGNAENYVTFRDILL